MTGQKPLVVSFGGGTNSVALLCGFLNKGIRPDLILFSDTGAEMPHTYDCVDLMRIKVNEWWGLELLTVSYKKTIVQHCHDTGQMPSLAYGRRSCSQKFKHYPMERYIKSWAKKSGITEITKAIGFDANERRRLERAPNEKYLLKNLREVYWYPLAEWGWRRQECIQAICDAKLPQPGKSACFLCPASKRSEVINLRDKHPDLLRAALNIEEEAQKTNRTYRGLGGKKNLWSDWLSLDAAQEKLWLDIEPAHLPCHCTV